MKNSGIVEIIRRAFMLIVLLIFCIEPRIIDIFWPSVIAIYFLLMIIEVKEHKKEIKSKNG